jgi:hypothetical protein
MYSDFISVHLRRGDKIIETNYISLETYRNEIIKQCNLNATRNVYVFTDLMHDGLKLKEILNGYNVTVFWLDENGYYHETYLKLPNRLKILKTKQLCDVVNIFYSAKHFIGSNDANLAAFVSLLREEKNVTDLRNGGLIIY